MDDINSVLKQLKENILLLLKENKTQKERIIQYEDELKETKKTVINLENKLKETEKENLTIRMSQSLEKKDDNGEIRRKINEMVREIDKCIAYLNK